MHPTLAIVHSGIILLAPHRSLVRLADVLRREVRPGEQILAEGPYEIFAGVDFYTGQRAGVLRGHSGDLEFSSHYPEPTERIVEEAEFVRRWQRAGRVYLFTDARLVWRSSPPSPPGRLCWAGARRTGSSPMLPVRRNNSIQRSVSLLPIWVEQQ